MRFIRIRGRVVPIDEKKTDRVNARLKSGGRAVAAAGAIAAGVGAARYVKGAAQAGKAFHTAVGAVQVFGKGITHVPGGPYQAAKATAQAGVRMMRSGAALGTLGFAAAVGGYAASKTRIFKLKKSVKPGVFKLNGKK